MRKSPDHVDRPPAHVLDYRGDVVPTVRSAGRFDGLCHFAALLLLIATLSLGIVADDVYLSLPAKVVYTLLGAPVALWVFSTVRRVKPRAVIAILVYVFFIAVSIMAVWAR
jgi:hypothetical protein